MKYEYVKDHWSDLLEKLKNGDIDLNIGIEAVICGYCS